MEKGERKRRSPSPNLSSDDEAMSRPRKRARRSGGTYTESQLQDIARRLAEETAGIRYDIREGQTEIDIPEVRVDPNYEVPPPPRPGERARPNRNEYVPVSGYLRHKDTGEIFPGEELKQPFAESYVADKYRRAMAREANPDYQFAELLGIDLRVPISAVVDMESFSNQERAEVEFDRARAAQTRAQNQTVAEQLANVANIRRRITETRSQRLALEGGFVSSIRAFLEISPVANLDRLDWSEQSYMFPFYMRWCYDLLDAVCLHQAYMSDAVLAGVRRMFAIDRQLYDYKNLIDDTFQGPPRPDRRLEEITNPENPIWQSSRVDRTISAQREYILVYYIIYRDLYAQRYLSRQMKARPYAWHGQVLYDVLFTALEQAISALPGITAAEVHALQPSLCTEKGDTGFFAPTAQMNPARAWSPLTKRLVGIFHPDPTNQVAKRFTGNPPEWYREILPNGKTDEDAIKSFTRLVYHKLSLNNRSQNVKIPDLTIFTQILHIDRQDTTNMLISATAYYCREFRLDNTLLNRAPGQLMPVPDRQTKYDFHLLRDLAPWREDYDFVCTMITASLSPVLLAMSERILPYAGNGLNPSGILPIFRLPRDMSLRQGVTLDTGDAPNTLRMSYFTEIPARDLSRLPLGNQQDYYHFDRPALDDPTRFLYRVPGPFDARGIVNPGDALEALMKSLELAWTDQDSVDTYLQRYEPLFWATVDRVVDVPAENTKMLPIVKARDAASVAELRAMTPIPLDETVTPSVIRRTFLPILVTGFVKAFRTYLRERQLEMNLPLILFDFVLPEETTGIEVDVAPTDAKKKTVPTKISGLLTTQEVVEIERRARDNVRLVVANTLQAPSTRTVQLVPPLAPKVAPPVAVPPPEPQVSLPMPAPVLAPITSLAAFLDSETKNVVGRVHWTVADVKAFKMTRERDLGFDNPFALLPLFFRQLIYLFGADQLVQADLRDEELQLESNIHNIDRRVTQLLSEQSAGDVALRTLQTSYLASGAAMASPLVTGRLPLTALARSLLATGLAEVRSPNIGFPDMTQEELTNPIERPLVAVAYARFLAAVKGKLDRDQNVRYVTKHHAQMGAVSYADARYALRQALTEYVNSGRRSERARPSSDGALVLRWR